MRSTVRQDNTSDASVARYLTNVYPTRRALQGTSGLLASLRYFYGWLDATGELCIHTRHQQHGLPVALALCGRGAFNLSEQGCLRVTSESKVHIHESPGPWIEVRHDAFGRRLSTDPISPTDRISQRWADFMDGGPAGMWYYPAKGTGIFYHAGRMLISESKNDAVARLLDKLSRNTLLTEWWPPQGLHQLELCTVRATCNDAIGLALRVRAASGPGGCSEAQLSHCGDGHTLDDYWDPVVVWLGRILGYDSIYFRATLCGCGWPCGPCAQTACPPRLSLTHPEVVDVRVPDVVRWRHDKQNRSLFIPGSPEHVSGTAYAGSMHRSLPALPTVRKPARMASDWMADYRTRGLLTLRDPLNVSDDSRARPCHFHASRGSLGCAGHLSQSHAGSSSEPRPLRRDSERRAADTGPKGPFVFAKMRHFRPGKRRRRHQHG